MKKIMTLLTLTLAGTLLVACGDKETESTKDTSWSKVEEKGSLTVATSGTLFPSSYYNDNNELVGYDVDIAKEVAKRLSVDISFKEYNVDGQIASLNNGDTDLAANDFSLSGKRTKDFVLTDTFKHSFSSLIVRKSDHSGITKLEDLDGKKAAGESNTSYMRFAESLGAEPVAYDNATNSQYLQDVANGRTDVIVNDYYLQKMSVAALPDIPVEILEGLYFSPDASGFLLVKGHEELLTKINGALKDMTEDGTLKDISETYFQTDVSVLPDVKMTDVEK